jgi:hypothetical protein
MYYLIVLVVVIIILKFVYDVNYIKYGLNKISLNCTIQDAKQGDLILFRWHTVDPFHDTISNFTHVGMVIQNGQEKYIIETHQKGDLKDFGLEEGGVQIYSLKSRIKTYAGTVFHLKLKKPVYKNINSKIQEYKKIPFAYKFRNDYLNRCILRIKNDTNGEMFCSHFIGHLLKESGILNKNTDVSCFSPGTFIDLKEDGEKLFENPIYINKIF